jgi:hypothetical protein
VGRREIKTKWQLPQLKTEGLDFGVSKQQQRSATVVSSLSRCNSCIESCRVFVWSCSQLWESGGLATISDWNGVESLSNVPVSPGRRSSADLDSSLRKSKRIRERFGSGRLGWQQEQRNPWQWSRFGWRDYKTGGLS